MPYIKPELRKELDNDELPTNPGELNYLITKLVRRYLEFHRFGDKETRYSHINDAIGALEAAKLELYRRIAVPYEDLKIEENGDVY
jgi:hypothetical protein